MTDPAVVNTGIQWLDIVSGAGFAGAFAYMLGVAGPKLLRTFREEMSEARSERERTSDKFIQEQKEQRDAYERSLEKVTVNMKDAMKEHRAITREIVSSFTKTLPPPPVE